MKILYDHQIFSLQKYGGISRYFFEIIKYLKNNDDKVVTSLFFSNNYYISNKKDVKHLKFLSNFQFRGKQRIMHFINKLYTIIILKKQKFDVFHPTYYDTYFLNYIGKKPFVVTVHDMIHEKFNENFSHNDKTTEQKLLLCQKASKIIVISQSTKNDLIEFFNIDESKIAIVYHGNSLVVSSNIKKDSRLPNKYILFVGSRGGYKNFINFIEGASSVLENHKNLSIVCVGGGKFNDEEYKKFKDLQIIDKMFQFNLDDDKLAGFYKNAEAFVFPSLYEGFGIPVLESFACDCPLVCSNTSSLPEIAGNAAEYFNPYDIESIAVAIENVLTNSQRREELRKYGKERLKAFSWEKTAEETKKIYQSVIQ